VRDEIEAHGRCIQRARRHAGDALVGAVVSELRVIAEHGCKRLPEILREKLAGENDDGQGCHGSHFVKRIGSSMDTAHPPHGSRAQSGARAT